MLQGRYEQVVVRYPAYLLAGGRSRRFGSNKARALFRGEPMISYVAGLLGERVSSVTVVAAHAGDYDDLGLRTIGDVIPDAGPAAGILTALGDWKIRRGETKGQPEFVLVCACDLIGLDPGWIDLLEAEALARGRSAVFRSDRVEPLFGLYHQSAAVVLDSCVNAGRFSMHEIIEEMGAVIAACPDGWVDVINTNTPGDLRRAES